MTDVILSKVANIQRSVKRAREEHASAVGDFFKDYTHQDAAILNVIRACETALDLANYVIRKRKLGLANSSRESFQLLVAADLIPQELGQKLEKMIAFRNVAVHEYTQLDIAIVEQVIQTNLDDVLAFSKAMATLE